MIVGKLTSGGMLNGWGDLSGMSIDESPKGKSIQPTLVEAVLSTRAVLQNYDARRGKTQHVEGISLFRLAVRVLMLGTCNGTCKMKSDEGTQYTSFQQHHPVLMRNHREFSDIADSELNCASVQTPDAHSVVGL